MFPRLIIVSCLQTSSQPKQASSPPKQASSQPTQASSKPYNPYFPKVCVLQTASSCAVCAVNIAVCGVLCCNAIAVLDAVSCAPPPLLPTCLCFASQLKSLHDEVNLEGITSINLRRE